MNHSRLRKLGDHEISAVLRRWKGSILSIGLFSVFTNLLMLTGPLFMLQIYDRVLGSRSQETLVALTALVVLLYGIMGVLDFARGRVAAQIGAGVQAALDDRVFNASLRRAVAAEARARPDSALQDLEAIQRLLASPALFAIFDLPWTPVFLFAIFIFHPMLGWLALGGGAVLILLTVLNQYLTRRPVLEASCDAAQAHALSESFRTQAEAVHGLGMQKAALSRWSKARAAALESATRAAHRTGFFTTFTKTLRLFLQSAMLALGAYLVLQNQMTAGAMIAGSILMGRALAPVEQAIGQWSLVQRARQGRKSLALMLGAMPEPPMRTDLPRPKAYLELSKVTAVPPGENIATLRMVSFRVEPGQALAVIGESASGKSTLARVLTGIWPAVSGKIRLDGAALEQYNPEDLGRYIGYLPQDVALFDGTISENIARLCETPDSEKVIAAAKLADAHNMILKLPDGYDTKINGGARLSGGQKQRIGLARALYDDPVLLVLDEPNSNLDSHGGVALDKAIEGFKAKGGAVVIMAHRPAGIAACNLALVLSEGVAAKFGPRDEVLKSMTQNYQTISGEMAPKGQP
jgi:ATP-binding cassette subfamily C protein